MLEIAHRGFSSIYNDNNIKAFKKAIEHKFNFIEMDLQLNKENEIVIYHDNSIHNFLISNLSTQEIKKYKIPLLRDFFEEIQIPKHMKIILDLKGSGDKLAIILYDFLINNNINLHQIIIASFNLNYLTYLEKQIFKISLGLITANNEFYIKPIIYKYIKYIIVDITVISDKEIKKLKKDNKIIFAYTCHDECEIELFQKKTIDGIISNVKIFK